MKPDTRLYRPRPPEHFTDGVAAWLDVKKNVVTYDTDVFDLTVSRDLRLLRQLDEVEVFYLSPYSTK